MRQYAVLMQEAIIEFRAWEDRRPGLQLLVGDTLFIRPARRRAPRCACGRLHFCRGKCVSCFFRAYNKLRPKRVRKSKAKPPGSRRRTRRRLVTKLVAVRQPKPQRLCACGQLHFARGRCKTCYFREYNATRPRR